MIKEKDTRLISPAGILPATQIITKSQPIPSLKH